MIARRWTARAEGSAQADAYVAHFESAVTPRLESTEGFLGATLERIQDADGTEIVVVTRWESMDAIRTFAGEQVDLAGDFHWHKHDDQDEFFLVLDGELLIEVEGSGTITLGQHQACSVPKGVLHRTRAPRRTTILMVEAAGVTPVGD